MSVEKKEYWNQRVEENRNDLRGMIWHSGVTLQHQDFARHLLSYFADKKVLDVACGYGRFSDIFDPKNYHGFDFADKMIDLARELHPEYSFEVADFDDPIKDNYDVIFQVISLNSLGITEQQFIEKYQKHASVVISIHGQRVAVYYNPHNMDIVCA